MYAGCSAAWVVLAFERQIAFVAGVELAKLTTSAAGAVCFASEHQTARYICSRLPLEVFTSCPLAA